MKVVQALKNATPLEKARAFSILGNPEFAGRSVKDKYIYSAQELIEDFKLTKYGEVILDELKNFKGKKRDWERDISSVVKQYQNELIDRFILKQLDTCPNLKEVKSKLLIEWAEVLAAFLVGRGLKTNQIRKFLDGVRKVEVNIKRSSPEEFTSKEVMFLKVHLAYAKARQEAVKPLMFVMNSAIDKVREEGKEGFKDFEQLIKFVEAVVAYHRFYGGSDS